MNHARDFTVEVRWTHQLLNAAEQQNHLVVCVPQVGDAAPGWWVR